MDYKSKCLQHAKQQEIRPAQKATIPPMLPPVPYSENEANLLSEKLKNVKMFKDALNVLVTWLDRGECNRTTCGSFYSMIQCVSSHTNRLILEKHDVEEARRSLQEQMRFVSLEFNKIMVIFNLVKLPNVWNNFTLVEKASIEATKEMTYDIARTHFQEVVTEGLEDEMEISDDDCVSENPSDSEEYRSRIEKIKVELEVLKNKLKAVQEDNDAIRRENGRNMYMRNKVFYENQEQLKAALIERDCLRKEEESLSALFQNEIVESSEETEDCLDQSKSSSNITVKEIFLISVINTFLSVHPFGASIHYLTSYLQNFDPTVNERYVESLLQSHENIFKEVISGIGASLTKTWVLVSSALIKAK